MYSKLMCAAMVIFSISVAEAEAPAPFPAWMAGHWCAVSGETTTEEVWLPAQGGMMVGLGRTRNPGHTTGFEYLRIVDLDGIQSFIAQPGGQPPTGFERTAGGENWIRFENPDHDFPQRIEYRKRGEILHAEVGGPADDGEESVIGLDYGPCGAQALEDDDTKFIRSARESSNQAIRRHDIKSIVSFLEDEYVITISSGVIEYGRETAAESWAGHFANFPDVVYVRTPEEVTISSSSPLAIENGTWVGTMTTPDGGLQRGGQYTAAWRKTDGEWKIYSELFVVLYEKSP